MAAVLDDPGRTSRRPRRSGLRTGSRPPARSAGRSPPSRRRAIAGPAIAITAPARRRPCATACQMPSIATDEPDLLLRQARRAGAERERQQPVLVEEPDRAEQQRCRERHRVEVVDHEPLRRRVEQVDEREAEPRPVASRGACGRAGTRVRRRARRATACTTRSSDGSGQSHQSGASTTTIGSKCAPSREICCSLEVGDLEEAAVRRRPDGLRRGCRRRSGPSRRPAAGAPRGRDMPAAKPPTRDRAAAARPGHRACDRALEQRPPARRRGAASLARAS